MTHDPCTRFVPPRLELDTPLTAIRPLSFFDPPPHFRRGHLLRLKVGLVEVRRGLEGSEGAGDYWGEEREVGREREEEVCEGAGSAVGAGLINACHAQGL